MKSVNESVKLHLDSILLGPAQPHHNFIVFPLKTVPSNAPPHATLDEALENGKLKITEVSEKGCIDELLARNAGSDPVVILGGEELLGARQNRVVSSTVWLEPKSETIIPVLCSEQHRWKYSTNQFMPSKSMMPWRLRARMATSNNWPLVSVNFEPDRQEVIWGEIEQLQQRSGVKSLTGAMNAVIKASELPARRFCEHFPLLPGQQGLFVFHHGEVAGFDLIPNPDVYARLHDKLVRSYTLEGMLEPKDWPRDTEMAAAKVGTILCEFLNAKKACSAKSLEEELRCQAADFSHTMYGKEGRLVHAAMWRRNLSHYF